MPVQTWQPCKLHVSKNSNMSFNTLLLKEFTIPFAVHVSHLIVEIFTFKKYIPVEKNLFFFRNKFPIIEYFECPTRIEEVPIGI